MLNIHQHESISVWNNKFSTIIIKNILANASNSKLPLLNLMTTHLIFFTIPQELSNPYVAENLEYYPHETSGITISSLHQSHKWREDPSHELIVQMVCNPGKHFDIFEPKGLISGEVVVPVFFYKFQEKIYAKCAVSEYQQRVLRDSFYIIILANLIFDSDLLNVYFNDFQETFEEIMFDDGLLFVDACDNTLIGEEFYS